MFFHHEFNKVIVCVQPLFEALALESPNTQHQLLAEKGFVCVCFFVKVVPELLHLGTSVG